MEDRIRKGASREMYNEIYKPITSEIESQKEVLSNQLADQLGQLALTQGKLALLPKQFVEKLREAEAAKLLEKPLPMGLTPPLLGGPGGPLEGGPYGSHEPHGSHEPLPEEDIKKLFEDYEKELGARPKTTKTILDDDNGDGDDDDSDDYETTPKEFKLNLNKDVDLSLLDTEKYNTPQEVFDFFHAKSDDPDEKLTREEINKIIDNVTEDIRSFSHKVAAISRMKNPTPQDEKIKTKFKNKTENLKKYRDTLNNILIQGSYMGQGVDSKSRKSPHSYKVSTDGQYGNLLINLNKLYSQNRLVAKDKDTGKEVMNMKVDDDSIDLINKRYDNKKTHSILSRKVFSELTEISGLPINKRSLKFQKVIRGKGHKGHEVCPCNPEELIRDLELICGSIDAGNNNQDIINEGISIIDELLKMNKLSPESHEMLYKNYFS